MLSGTRRCGIGVGVLWFCLLAKLVFYAGFVPLWEGYDEFPHFAFVQHLVHFGEIPDLRNASISREVTASLRVAPVAWMIRQWNPGWITQDAFWKLPADTRQQRVRDLKNIPPDTGREPDRSLRQYEAQQAPLAYLLYAIPYSVFQSAGLLTRAWILRVSGCAIVSLVTPVAFLLARRVFDSPTQALMAVAIVTSLPELMILVSHGGNEPLAIVLSTALAWALCSTCSKPVDWRHALLMGCLLGCGLLTKAYFLTMVPAIIGIYVVVFWRTPEARRRIAVQLATKFAVTGAIAGWWYVRAFLATGNFTGSSIAADAGRSSTTIPQALRQVNWFTVADSGLTSHIWLGGWSYLVLRSWMYHGIELIFFAACFGIALRVARRRLSFPLAVCTVLLLSMWLATAWYGVLTYLATGESDVPGYYTYALVGPEAICLIAGLSAFIPTFLTRFIAPVLVTCFAAIEVYGTTFLLMPYYAGITAHTSRGNVPAMKIGWLIHGGMHELFSNLAVNKADFLSSRVLTALWIAFLLGVAGIVAVSYLAAFSERGKA